MIYLLEITHFNLPLIIIIQYMRLSLQNFLALTPASYLKQRAECPLSEISAGETLFTARWRWRSASPSSPSSSSLPRPPPHLTHTTATTTEGFPASDEPKCSRTATCSRSQRPSETPPTGGTTPARQLWVRQRRLGLARLQLSISATTARRNAFGTGSSDSSSGRWPDCCRDWYSRCCTGW